MFPWLLGTLRSWVDKIWYLLILFQEKASPNNLAYYIPRNRFILSSLFLTEDQYNNKKRKLYIILLCTGFLKPLLTFLSSLWPYAHIIFLHRFYQSGILQQLMSIFIIWGNSKQRLTSGGKLRKKHPEICKRSSLGKQLTESRDPALALAMLSFSFSDTFLCTAWKLFKAAEKSFIRRSFWSLCWR